ncbi:MAG: RAMP superfamily CRISPR-associated protein [Propionibacteriaceae bacterium]|jgi:CRISPR-associated protein Csx10|nr:RAMP superfamily CRISPR-associated protein [Propionibacteriaceae bacterium]
MTTQFLKASATFASDWSIGAGTSRDRDIDSAIVLDDDGLPYVPAGTMVGMLRQQALAIADGLDAAAPPNAPVSEKTLWREWHTWLFGSNPAEDERVKGKRRRRGSEKNDASDVRAMAPSPRPVPAALRPTPLRLTEPVRHLVESVPTAGSSGEERSSLAPTRESFQRATRCDRVGVSIDPTTGTAREDFLRFEERALAGLTVESHGWEIAFPEGTTSEEVEPALLLLEAAGATLTAIGGKRRRGAGRLDGRGITFARRRGEGEFTTPLSREEVADRLDTLSRGGILRPPSLQPQQSAFTDDAEVSTRSPGKPSADSTDDADDLIEPGVAGQMVHVADLTITTLGPVLVAPKVRGNIVETSMTIPGSALLPLLAEAVGARFGAWVRAGDIRVSEATPLVVSTEGEEVSTTAWPRCLVRPKRDDHSTVGLKTDEFANAPDFIDHDEASTVATWKPKSDRYLATSPVLKGGEETVFSWTAPQTCVISRAVVDDELGRPLTERGGPFAFVALSPNQRFQAEVWSRQGDSGLGTGRKCQARIGTARKGDYGLVEVELTMPRASGREAEATVSSRNVLTVIALSDLLLTDAAGAFAPTPCQWVEALNDSADTVLHQLHGLGKEDVPATADAGDEKKDPSHARLAGARVVPAGDDDHPWYWLSVNRHEGWQSRWCLPRPSLVTIAAGSVLRVVAPEGVSPVVMAEVVRRWETVGIGERRVEGFGRLAIDPLCLRGSRITVDEATQTGSSTRRGFAESHEPLESVRAPGAMAEHRSGAVTPGNAPWDDQTLLIARTAWRRAIDDAVARAVFGGSGAESLSEVIQEEGVQGGGTHRADSTTPAGTAQTRARLGERFLADATPSALGQLRDVVGTLRAQPQGDGFRVLGLDRFEAWTHTEGAFKSHGDEQLNALRRLIPTPDETGPVEGSDRMSDPWRAGHPIWDWLFPGATVESSDLMAIKENSTKAPHDTTLPQACEDLTVHAVRALLFEAIRQRTMGSPEASDDDAETGDGPRGVSQKTTGTKIEEAHR